MLLKPIPFSEGDVADHLYPLRLAEFGDLIRCPKALYTKQTHPQSATAPQRQTGRGRQLRICHVIESCVSCYTHVVAKLNSENYAQLCKIAFLARLIRILEGEWPIQEMETVSNNDWDTFGYFLSQRHQWIFQFYESVESIRGSDLADKRIMRILKSLSRFYLATISESLHTAELTKILISKPTKAYDSIAQYDEFFEAKFQRLLNSCENQ
ncbi:MAG: hypothetical protein HOM55_00465 [Proteobacteria bacterium]|nr:hypothetical protein [Pseudomonadota bacterium]